MSIFYARGILVDVGDSVTDGDTSLTPWEFYIVHDIRDASCYIPALLALQNRPYASSEYSPADVPDPLGSARLMSGGRPYGHHHPHAAVHEEEENNDAEGDEDGDMVGGGSHADAHHRPRAFSRHSSLFGRRGDCLLLYTRLAAPFTGVYPGMALGIAGEPFQRSAHGVLTGVMVHRFFLPHDPILPWTLHRGLMTQQPPPHDRRRVVKAEGSRTPVHMKRAAPLTCSSSSAAPSPLRIHFCSGPFFPRADIPAVLRSAIVHAIHRDADLLVIGGPLIRSFDESEKSLLPTLGATFAELLDFYMDTMEETLESYDAAAMHTSHSAVNHGTNGMSSLPARKRVKILLVPHRDDVTQMPVLPTAMYALKDTPDIIVRSSPCRVAVAGVHVGVCNEDVVTAMQSALVERGQTGNHGSEARVRRAVRALVRSRVYCPLFRLPARHVDVRHWGQLYLDYAPAGNELLQLDSATSTATLLSPPPATPTLTPATTKATATATTCRAAQWNAMFDRCRDDVTHLCQRSGAMKRERSESCAGTQEEASSCAVDAVRKEVMRHAPPSRPRLKQTSQTTRSGAEDAEEEEAAASQMSVTDEMTCSKEEEEACAEKKATRKESCADEADGIRVDSASHASSRRHRFTADTDECGGTGRRRTSPQGGDRSESDAEGCAGGGASAAVAVDVPTVRGDAYNTDEYVQESDVAVECMPHILFLPSTQPAFAHLTQAHVPHYMQPWAGCRKADDVDTLCDERGVLVINQGIASASSTTPFALRVVEVTIPCAEAVARQGVSENDPENGVTCCLLHVPV